MPDRAVVAVSEDRQWLVVLEPEKTGRFLRMWFVYQRQWNGDYMKDRYIQDTGQDAHEVLREWMEGRDA